MQIQQHLPGMQAQQVLDWQHGCCEFPRCSTCCGACFCAPCMMSRIMSKAGLLSRAKGFLLFIIPMCLYYYWQNRASQFVMIEDTYVTPEGESFTYEMPYFFNMWMWLPAMMCAMFYYVIGSRYRSKLRASFGISGSGCYDFMFHTCCHCCSVNQMALEVDRRSLPNQAPGQYVSVPIANAPAANAPGGYVPVAQPVHPRYVIASVTAPQPQVAYAQAPQYPQPLQVPVAYAQAPQYPQPLQVPVAYV